MIDNSIGAPYHDALATVVRSILELQKRQVELYESQVVEIDFDPKAVSRSGGAASKTSGSKLVCQRVGMRRLDDAPEDPVKESREDPVKESKSSTFTGNTNVSPFLDPHEMHVRTWNGKKVSELVKDAIWQNSIHPGFHAHPPLVLTAAARRTLLFWGAIPAEVFPKGFCKNLYRAYRYFILFSFVATGLIHFLITCLRVRSGHVPLEMGYFIVLTFIGPVIIVKLWRHLGSGGVYLDMMHQMSRRNFDWKLLDHSAHCLWLMIVLLMVLISLGVIGLWQAGELTTSAIQNEEHASHIQVLDKVAQISWASTLPLMAFCAAQGSCMIWCIWLFSQLHAQDLMNYGLIITRVIEEDEDCNPVLMLKHMELTTTARLRHADKTWVQQVMIVMCVMVTLSLMIGSLLFSSHSMRETIAASLWLVWSVVAIGVVATSLARPAAAFEHDVFKTLNNPLVLHKAQRYFGQQFLAHLHGLEWGFRFSGNVINAKLSFRLIFALATSAIITVSQASFALIDDATF